MTGSHVSLILIPTLRCNANCEYCFENKSSHSLSTKQFRIILEKMADYMDENHFQDMTIFWQGGEVFTLSPEWFWRAKDIVEQVSSARNKRFLNRIQSNMMEYNDEWQSVISQMFGNRVSSSLDYPNVYRKLNKGAPDTYNRTWFRNVLQARGAGIHVGVISIPNNWTLAIGAQRFYAYFVREMGLKSFQINTPFPGGARNAAKNDLPLDPIKLASFLIDLTDVWIEEGFQKGVSIGPFSGLLNYFLYDAKALPCIWHANCTDQFFCIDPRGQVSQCDCWVASYPEFWFGNIFDSLSVSEILKSEARTRIRQRPAKLIEHGECISCDYLTLCHGGCPIRTFTTKRDLIATDPYCETYKALFAHVAEKAVNLARRGKSVIMPAQQLRPGES
jgi:uncharacterized protein